MATAFWIIENGILSDFHAGDSDFITIIALALNQMHNLDTQTTLLRGHFSPYRFRLLLHSIGWDCLDPFLFARCLAVFFFNFILRRMHTFFVISSGRENFPNNYCWLLTKWKPWWWMKTLTNSREIKLFGETIENGRNVNTQNRSQTENINLFFVDLVVCFFRLFDE